VDPRWVKVHQTVTQELDEDDADTNVKTYKRHKAMTIKTLTMTMKKYNQNTHLYNKSQ
jgi:hypothetical protein